MSNEKIFEQTKQQETERQRRKKKEERRKKKEERRKRKRTGVSIDIISYHYKKLKTIFTYRSVQ